MHDLMIDLETLGTNSDTPVISLGAAFFNVKTKELGPTFYMALDISEQIERGRKPSGDTIKWWMNQKDAAKKVFHEKAKSTEEVLNTFVKWYRANSPQRDNTYVWGNGATFDISIMEHLFQDYGLDIPWTFRRVMDMRTFKRFAKTNNEPKRNGTHHNALDDAIWQAKYVLENL